MYLDLTNKSEAVRKLLERMEAHIEETGCSEAVFASSVGSSNALFKNLRKGSMPSIDRLNAILLEMGETLVIGDIEALAPENPYPSETALEGLPFVTVARFDARAAAGGGVVNFDAEPVDHLAFSKPWLRQNGIQAGSCSLINAFGKSMEPSIWDGDLIMIDHRRTEINNRRLYVYNDPDNGTRVKRLELSADVIAVHSDNPDKQEFPTEYHTGSAMNAISENIIGEVVWSGHKWS